MAEGTGGAVPSSLAQRLDNLFTKVRKPGGREYSHREVAEAITLAGEPISYSYIGQLRAGDKDNPTLRHLRALARFFGVPVEYFTSERLAAEVDRELDLAAALQDLRVQTVALRESVLPEAERSMASLSRIVEVIRQLEQGGQSTSGPH